MLLAGLQADGLAVGGFSLAETLVVFIQKSAALIPSSSAFATLKSVVQGENGSLVLLALA